MDEKYIEIIRPLLTTKRFIHSIRVSEASGILAEKYGGNKEKAAIAGILHDIMKDTDYDEQLKIMTEFGIMLSGVERFTPKLWHQISGAAYVQYKLGIDDQEILDAIRYHTSGRGNMSILEKIVFVADFISADRDYPGVEQMREYAEKNLDKAILEGTSFVICELAKEHRPIINDTLDAYNQAIRGT